MNADLVYLNLIEFENPGFLVPKGFSENNPTFQRRGLSERERVPKERLTIHDTKTSVVPSGLVGLSTLPGVQTPGYYRESLRDKICKNTLVLK